MGSARYSDGVLRTPLAEVVPSVLFVGMDATFVDSFRKDFPAVRGLNVAHAAAARERIPVTRPLVVVVGSAVPKEEVEEMTDIAGAVGCELVRLAGDAVSPIAYFRIKKAIIEVLERRTR